MEFPEFGDPRLAPYVAAADRRRIDGERAFAEVCSEIPEAKALGPLSFMSTTSRDSLTSQTAIGIFLIFIASLIGYFVVSSLIATNWQWDWLNENGTSTLRAVGIVALIGFTSLGIYRLLGLRAAAESRAFFCAEGVLVQSYGTTAITLWTDIVTVVETITKDTGSSTDALLTEAAARAIGVPGSIVRELSSSGESSKFHRELQIFVSGNRQLDLGFADSQESILVELRRAAGRIGFRWITR
ncbi:MAG: hypothetical protein IT428_05075 [Planctomycetaceae bacterium]|nr:hypothetical protein [Planctomycetaceae bacterium]